MKKAHIILSHPSVYVAKGTLGASLCKETKKFLEEAGYKCTVTDTEEDYTVSEEGERFFESELIVFHFPMFWFATPSSLKEYMDQVYIGAKFFDHSEGELYGTGGKLTKQKYIVVTTLNSQEISFKKGTFFNGLNIDDVYRGFHLAQKYVGMKHIATVAHHDVIQGDTSNIAEEHLKKLSAIKL